MNKDEMEQKTRRWSLRLALASDDQDWDEVNAVCGEINAAYCDLAYSKATETSEATVMVLDVYGDGEVLVHVEPQEDLERLLAEWVDQDKQYLKGDLDQEEWQGVSDFLKARGVRFVEVKHIELP